MERSGSRLKILAFVVAFMFVALSTRLWFLQVLAGPQHDRDARDNSLRTVATDALRGDILDRRRQAPGPQPDQPRGPHQARRARGRGRGDARTPVGDPRRPGAGARRGARHEALLQLPTRSRRRVRPGAGLLQGARGAGEVPGSRGRGAERPQLSAGTARGAPGGMGRSDQRRGDRRSALRRLRPLGPGREGGYRGHLRAMAAREAGRGAVPRQLRRRGPPRVRPDAGGAWSRPSALARPRRPADRRGRARRRAPTRADRLRYEHRAGTWRRTRAPWSSSIPTRAGSCRWRRGPPSARPGS